MRTYSIFNILVIFELLWDFSDCLFLPSLSLLFTLVVFMAPKRKSTPSQNPLRSGASSSSDPLLLIFGSVMRMPESTSRRTFLNKVFIRNAESFWRTSSTLTFPLSFTVRDGSHLSICADLGVLLQHAWIRFFSTSLFYSFFRYTHCSHTAACCRCASCFEGRAS